jgi:uncharacterized glyoxalase superfamily protein PhnB
MLTRLTPMLWTNDLAGTIAFYTEQLQFQLDEYNSDWGWCHLHCDNVALMFARPNDHAHYDGKPGFTGSFYIYTEKTDELWNQLSTSVIISYPIENFPHGMREFAILDNNGYMLQFGRELREEERES